jgi:hypothetical protein
VPLRGTLHASGRADMIYITNHGPQHHVLDFRGAARNARQRQIPPGGQIYVDADRPSLDAAVAHLRKYGAVAVSELPQGRRFNGLAYQFDAPIDAAAIPTDLDRFTFPAWPATEGWP